MNSVISTNESTELLTGNSTGHVIYIPAYSYKLQLKTTLIYLFYSMSVMSTCIKEEEGKRLDVSRKSNKVFMKHCLNMFLVLDYRIH